MAAKRRSRSAWFRRQTVRLAVTVVGFVVLLAGLIMLVTPGPGILVLVAGLAILAREYAWAERFLHQVREKAEVGYHAATASPARIALSVAITVGAITAVVVWWMWL